ncbi:hypothetical protein M2375_000165 [Comamonas sp. BIGb0152]|uniref:DUF2076 domain-containing protein n=1 Tax=Comamonas sp. BIGb0152 TaxID=2940601 RepID=UPI00216A48A1|nr:DUF2076 domain-containing protein [Comamonas sp. BIGb0152]MCS4291970.1 hypothetical protein [Comamonas sp. BIGb0152]
MNAQEQALIENLFQQLRQLDGQPKESQAEACIRQQAQQSPDALYWLTQRSLLLEQALQQAQQRQAQLQAQLAEARAAAAKPAGSSGTSFLGAGLDTHFGRSPDANLASRSPAGYAPSYPQNNAASVGYGDTPAPASSGRWFGAAPAAPAPVPASMPAQLSAGSAAGGFLGQAAASVAGVAGGMLLFNGLSHLWSNPAQAASTPAPAASDTSKAASSTDTAAASSDNSGLDQLAQQAGRDHVDPSANRWMPDADNNSSSNSQDVADYDNGDDGFDFFDDDQA